MKNACKNAGKRAAEIRKFSLHKESFCSAYRERYTKTASNGGFIGGGRGMKGLILIFTLVGMGGGGRRGNPLIGVGGNH